MEKKIKLNLGCGNIYKQGYINIDKFDNSVADRLLDISNLPFKDNSVDFIEALQLIEHFDYIHCKYILSEWFRVLKPNSQLVLETPDLEKTFKKFINGNLEIKKTSLQWIYGIDSNGMMHKTGFSIDLLKELLAEIGFEKINNEEQQTHTYEFGIRIKCYKPRNFERKLVISKFRRRLIKELDTNDSYYLIPLENYIKNIDIFSKEISNEYVDTIISKTAYCNPKISLIFLEECINQKLVNKEQYDDKMKFLKFLIDKNFHKKVFSLWLKRRKTQEIEDEIKNFIMDIESLLLETINDYKDFRERLSYILNLKPYPIKLFDFVLVFEEAEKFFNLGLKEIQNNKISRAKGYLLKSLKLNPMLKTKILELERFKSIRVI